MLPKTIAEFESHINYQFNNKQLIAMALTHASCIGEPNYERLEFLGDAIWRSIIVQKLYHLKPDYDEGQLAITTADLTSNDSMAIISQELQLGNWLKFGNAQTDNIRYNLNILSDLFESVVGALYLDNGQAIIEIWANKSIKKYFTDNANTASNKTLNSILQSLMRLTTIKQEQLMCSQISNKQWQCQLNDHKVVADNQNLAQILALLQWQVQVEMHKMACQTEINIVYILKQVGYSYVNSKSQLNNYCQKLQLPVPEYCAKQSVTNNFTAICHIKEKQPLQFYGEGSSKKQSEQDAALKALLYLNQL